MMKTSNEYVAALGVELFGAIPKAVLAAIAVSFATSGGDRLDDAAALVITEWHTLHQAGIIPQPVPARHRGLIISDDEL
jgi:hypothetical protein